MIVILMNKEITGTIINVSDPKAYKIGKKTCADYFHLTLKEASGREILIYISSSALGLYSESQSKIYVFDKKNKRLLKHRMATPSRLLNQKVKVNGELVLNHDGWYMNYVSYLEVD